MVMAVTPQANTGTECHNVAVITASAGRSRFARRVPNKSILGVLLLAVAAAMTPAIAHSSKPAASVSSGSVQISVSIAPKYRLTVTAPSPSPIRPAVHSDRVCLGTNASVPSMPVNLVRSLSKWIDVGREGVGANEPAPMGIMAGTWRCSPIDDGAASDFLNAEDRAAGPWLLVRPE